MTMRVTILSTVMGESGSLLAAGSTYTVGDQFGQELVNSGRATDTDRALAVPQTELKPYFATDPLTGAVTGLVGPGGVKVGLNIGSTALTAVVLGNSIVVAQKYEAVGAGTCWTTRAEIHIANALAGSPLVFPRITATTRADKYGVYGYSGQTLPTITADLPAQLWAPVDTALVLPQIIIGLALLENDVAGGATTAAMILSLTAFVRDTQARYPGAILLLATPRPSFSYDSAAKVLAYQAIRDYTLTLDNGHNIFVSRLDTYENPASPGTPLGTSGSPIYTDNSVHPNGKGAFRNARVLAATLKRIAQSVKQSYRCVGTNLAMIGTGAASGTNVSGTVPTSVTITGTANGTFVGTAEQPGFMQTITANASGAEPPADLGTSTVASIAISGGASTQLSAFMEVEIVSGAENIAWLLVRPRFTGTGGGNVFLDFVKRNTNDIDPEFANGDVLLFRQPPIMVADVTGVSGNFNGCQLYFEAKPKITGGAFSFRVKSAGVGIVVA